jgi:hypothetical protein
MRRSPRLATVGLEVFQETRQTRDVVGVVGHYSHDIATSYHPQAPGGGSVSAHNPSRPRPPGQAGKGPIDVRPNWANLFPDDDPPPDEFQEFAALVAARKAGDSRKGDRHRLALLDLGWRISPIEPRRAGGGRR